VTVSINLKGEKEEETECFLMLVITTCMNMTRLGNDDPVLQLWIAFDDLSELLIVSNE
jgi:hypothetical protein